MFVFLFIDLKLGWFLGGYRQDNLALAFARVQIFYTLSNLLDASISSIVKLNGQFAFHKQLDKFSHVESVQVRIGGHEETRNRPRLVQQSEGIYLVALHATRARIGGDSTNDNQTTLYGETKGRTVTVHCT